MHSRQSLCACCGIRTESLNKLAVSRSLGAVKAWQLRCMSPGLTLKAVNFYHTALCVLYDSDVKQPLFP
jgi:hypothetical protein